MNIKTIILGASGVGKTRFLNHLRKTTMTSYCPTIGVDFVVYRGNYSVTLQIWDTSGSNRFKSVVNNFLKGCDLIVFVYNDKQTFEHMMQMIADVKDEEYGKRFCILSLGNVELGKIVAAKYGFFFFHVNIKKREDCLSVLNKLSHLCYEEQLRTNFLKLKSSSDFSVERPRESGYCWWSFC